MFGISLFAEEMSGLTFGEELSRYAFDGEGGREKGGFGSSNVSLERVFEEYGAGWVASCWRCRR